MNRGDKKRHRRQRLLFAKSVAWARRVTGANEEEARAWVTDIRRFLRVRPVPECPGMYETYRSTIAGPFRHAVGVTWRTPV